MWFEYCQDFHLDPADVSAFDRVTALVWERWKAWRIAKNKARANG